MDYNYISCIKKFQTYHKIRMVYMRYHNSFQYDHPERDFIKINDQCFHKVLESAHIPEFMSPSPGNFSELL